MLQLGLPVQAILSAAGEPTASAIRSDRTEAGQRQILSHLSEDPLWEAFLQAPAIPHPEYDRADPAIDQDPFFMRSQKWADVSGAPDEEPSFAKSGGDLIVRLPEQKRALSIHAPLTPIHFTDEYVILTLDRESDLFDRVTRDMAGEVASEGVFFIDYRELVAKSSEERPVLVHFFPLPGSGWKGALDASEIPGSDDAISLTNSEGDSVPIAISDLTKIQKIQDLNFSMGAMLALGASPGQADLETLLPARGSTMVFGSFFTGLDLDHRDRSLWESASVKDPRISAKIADILSKFIPSAHADPSLYQGLIDKLIFFGWLFGAATTMSIVMKYTILKDRLAKIHRITESSARKYAEWYAKENAAGTLPKNSPKPKNVDGLTWKLTRPIKDVASIFGTIMVRLGQVSTVMGANFIEMFFDASMPERAASDHSGVRKFLNATFNWTRKVSGGFTVNWFTLWLGAIVFGLGDTLQVGIQTFWLWPLLLGMVSAHAGAFLQSRIESVFNIGNPNYTAFAWQDLGRNMLSHMMKGPGGYQADTKAQQESVIRKDVEEKMKAEGLDPILNIQERDRRIEQALDKKLQQMGIPGHREFLGDINSDWRFLTKWMGFSGDDARKGLRSNAAFLGEVRPSLIGSVLKVALREARRRAEKNPGVYGPVAKLYVGLLDEMRLSRNIAHPVDGFRAAKRIRQRLTVLTYVGPITEMAKYVPQEWKDGYSAETAQMASQIYRQVMHSVVQKDPTAVMTTPELLETLPTEIQEKAAAESQKSALSEISRKYPSEPEAAVASAHPAEFEARIESAVRTQVEAYAARKRAEAYAPPKESWYEYRQTQTALRKTLERFTAEKADALDEEKQQDRFNDIYARALAETLGLSEVKDSPETESFFTHVDREAKKVALEELSNDEGVKFYLGKASANEARRFKAQLYAGHWLRVFKEGAVDQDLIPGISAAQPGVFQWLRKTDFVKKSSKLTRLIRGVESFCASEQTTTLGLTAALDRTIPGFYDLRTGMVRNLRTFPAGATFGWAFSFYLMNVKIAWPLYLFLIARGFLIYAPQQWLNRLYRTQGIKPMGGTLQKILYSIPYSWMTMFGQPLNLFMNDVTGGFERHVEVPIGQALNDAQQAASSTCRQILGGK